MCPAQSKIEMCNSKNLDNRDNETDAKRYHQVFSKKKRKSVFCTRPSRYPGAVAP